MPATYRLTLFRAAQEGLTNIQRHAQAKDIWLTLSCQANGIMLSISDNGIGYSDETKPAGFGLLGLKERAALLGGQVTFGNRPEGGAQLALSLPLPVQAEGNHE